MKKKNLIRNLAIVGIGTIIGATYVFCKKTKEDREQKENKVYHKLGTLIEDKKGKIKTKSVSE